MTHLPVADMRRSMKVSANSRSSSSTIVTLTVAIATPLGMTTSFTERRKSVPMVAVPLVAVYRTDTSPYVPGPRDRGTLATPTLSDTART